MHEHSVKQTVALLVPQIKEKITVMMRMTPTLSTLKRRDASECTEKEGRTTTTTGTSDQPALAASSLHLPAVGALTREVASHWASHWAFGKTPAFSLPLSLFEQPRKVLPARRPKEVLLQPSCSVFCISDCLIISLRKQDTRDSFG